MKSITIHGARDIADEDRLVIYFGAPLPRKGEAGGGFDFPEYDGEALAQALRTNLPIVTLAAMAKHLGYLEGDNGDATEMQY